MSCWANVGLIFGQYRRRWANIKPTLGQHIMFTALYSVGAIVLNFAGDILHFYYKQPGLYISHLSETYVEKETLDQNIFSKFLGYIIMSVVSNCSQIIKSGIKYYINNNNLYCPEAKEYYFIFCSATWWQIIVLYTWCLNFATILKFRHTCRWLSYLGYMDLQLTK